MDKQTKIQGIFVIKFAYEKIIDYRGNFGFDFGWAFGGQVFVWRRRRQLDLFWWSMGQTRQSPLFDSSKTLF